MAQVPFFLILTFIFKVTILVFDMRISQLLMDIARITIAIKRQIAYLQSNGNISLIIHTSDLDLNFQGINLKR